MLLEKMLVQERCSFRMSYARLGNNGRDKLELENVAKIYQRRNESDFRDWSSRQSGLGLTSGLEVRE